MKETLTSRLMDRPIRPLFPEGFVDEVQIQANVMAADKDNDSDVIAMNGASVALGLSKMPFQGPLGSVRLARSTANSCRFRRSTNLKNRIST